MEAIQTYKSKKNPNQVLEIFQDEAPLSPREWDNIGIMLCAHRSYTLGDEQFQTGEGIDARIKELKPIVTIPLYLLDHSGLRIRTRDFTDCDPQQWDSGQVGYIITTEEKIKSMHGDTKLSDERVREILQSEVNEYDDYLSGNVFGYVLSENKTCNLDEDHKEELDSCWGFIGDIKDCLSGTNINLEEFEEV